MISTSLIISLCLTALGFLVRAVWPISSINTKVGTLLESFKDMLKKMEDLSTKVTDHESRIKELEQDEKGK